MGFKENLAEQKIRELAATVRVLSDDKEAMPMLGGLSPCKCGHCLDLQVERRDQIKQESYLYRLEEAAHEYYNAYMNMENAEDVYTKRLRMFLILQEMVSENEYGI